MQQVLADAELLFHRRDIDHAVDQLAVRISVEFYERNPLVVCVMNGGVSLTADLLHRLHFPLQFDYVHATRYRNSTEGAAVEWLREPSVDCRGRAVLIVDDILDEGVTLAAVVQRFREQGASSVKCAVLLRKQLARPPQVTADFVALECPDRYVFGRGMDYQGYWRNLSDIYALKAATP
ncbi:MAG: hypoxanthine-guanine phosphoribosyltransferase [Gammaproteobacteria bacterium]|nr:hypoxanthine-guanine phosphoribosyltransferase [Gammaproteobacteria bacterium]